MYSPRSEYRQRSRDRRIQRSGLSAVSDPRKLSCCVTYLVLLLFGRAIARTLNSDYSTQPYGLGGVNTRYPISAFITDLIYLQGTQIIVDAKKITVSVGFYLVKTMLSTRTQAMGVRCRQVKRGSRFDADIVAFALEEVWQDVR